jgi:hypothetical protein
VPDADVARRANPAVGLTPGREVRGVRVASPAFDLEVLEAAPVVDGGGPLIGACSAWRRPLPGSSRSSFSIGRIAASPGHHQWTFHGRLVLMPMMTTKSPSIRAE